VTISTRINPSFKIINEIVSENITKSIPGTLNLSWPNLYFFSLKCEEKLIFWDGNNSRLNCIFGTLPFKIVVLAY
jgi:hypothetical protein